LVTNPQEVHEALRVLGSAGEIPIVIYRLSDAPAPEQQCEHLQNNWLYKGTHKIRYNDNDFTLDGPGGNSFSFKAQGIVYDPDGAPYRYTENQHGLYGPDNDFRGWKTEFIRVHPIGKQ
jgi:hypothetical protein